MRKGEIDVITYSLNGSRSSQCLHYVILFHAKETIWHFVISRVPGTCTSTGYWMGKWCCFLEF